MKYWKASNISVRLGLHHSVLDYLLLLPQKSVQLSERGRVDFDVLARKLTNLVPVGALQIDCEAVEYSLLNNT